MSATQSGSTSSEYFSHLSDCVPTRDGAASNSANDDADASARRRAPDGARETNAVQRESAASARSRMRQPLTFVTEGTSSRTASTRAVW